MIDVTIGIDIGTSYTKSTACTEDGAVVAAYRLPTPLVGTRVGVGLVDAAACWACVMDLLRLLLTQKRRPRFRLRSLCISAIAPTLTVFDATQPNRAYAILYSALAKLPSLDFHGPEFP